MGMWICCLWWRSMETSGRSASSRRLDFLVCFWKVEKRGRTYYAPVRCISKWLDMWSCMKAWAESEVGSVVWHVGTHRDVLGRFSGHWFCEVVAILDAHFLGRR